MILGFIPLKGGVLRRIRSLPTVRVAPYYFEPIDTYLERYPDIADCFCFASDYPHREGGRRTKEAFYNRLAPLGGAVRRKFFRDNGSWLLPD